MSAPPLATSFPLYSPRSEPFYGARPRTDCLRVLLGRCPKRGVADFLRISSKQPENVTFVIRVCASSVYASPDERGWLCGGRERIWRRETVGSRASCTGL